MLATRQEKMAVLDLLRSDAVSSKPRLLYFLVNIKCLQIKCFIIHSSGLIQWEPTLNLKSEAFLGHSLLVHRNLASLWRPVGIHGRKLRITIVSGCRVPEGDSNLQWGFFLFFPGSVLLAIFYQKASYETQVTGLSKRERKIFPIKKQGIWGQSCMHSIYPRERHAGTIHWCLNRAAM